MKKTYLQPEVSVYNTAAKNALLDGSLKVNETGGVSGTSGGWTKEENAWDIWGNDEIDEEEF